MANTKSARKRVGQNERNRQRNRQARTVLRSHVKQFRTAVSAGDAEAAGQLLPNLHAIIDKTAKKGVIHARTADRYKSRLSLAHQRLVAAGASS